MDFKNASELLALCTQQQLPISEIMRRRECQLGETTRDEVTHRMKRAFEIMRSSALTPLKTPVKSMGGLIGGEAKKLAQHAAKHALGVVDQPAEGGVFPAGLQKLAGADGNLRPRGRQGGVAPQAVQHQQSQAVR